MTDNGDTPRRPGSSSSAGKFANGPADSSERPKTDSGDVDFGAFVSDAARRFYFGRENEPETAPPGSGGDRGDEGTRRNRVPFAIAGAIGAILVVTFGMSQVLQDGDSEPSPTPVPTLEPTVALVTPTVAPTSAPTATLAPTEIPPTPEPTRDLTASEIGRQCETACIVRIAETDGALATLKSGGVRVSFQWNSWLWAVAPHETVATLDLDGEDITLVSARPDTLNLYVTRLPEGQTDMSVLDGFGEILDAAEGVAIVMVDQVPAQVRDLANAGIDVQKFAPLTSSSPATGGGKPVLTDSDLGGLVGEIEIDNLTTYVTDLQATSSTDGSGIGTRQYLQPGNVMAAEFLFTELERHGLTVRYGDFITPEGTLASNIVGEIPGRDPSAIYGIMAHFDSTAESFAVAPGADDNATGLAAALEIARILARYELEHPVHVIFVNAEETGIIGSRIFAQQASVNEVPYEGIFNLDAIGSNRRGQFFWLNSDGASEWMMALMIRINDAYGLGQDIQARQNPGIVADDNRLREYGFESILVARELFGESPYHHTSQDVIENMSIENTYTATQLMLLTIASLVVE
jgi:cell division septation protein DedD